MTDVAAGSAAEPDPGHTCLGTELTVYAVDPLVAERVCNVVASADPALTACGLSDYGPLNIYVVERIERIEANYLGVYLDDSNSIAVLNPVVLGDTQVLGAEFDAIAPGDFFESLIVHELTHARLSHLPGGGDIGVVNHEYIAYTMQLETLSPEERHKFLIKYADRELDVAMINVFTLSFSPGLFASLAWRHFDQAADGCAFVQSLIDRSFSLEYLND